MLVEILKVGGLLPGYAFRNGRTTIYGGKPAVCFTEAPLHNFVRYVEERADSTRCAHYGVCILKRDLFAAGGRPAIYSLAGDGLELVCDTSTIRIIAPNLLPLAEQFRYVAYDPNRARPLDWTHERECRWISNSSPEQQLFYETYAGADFYDGLPLFRPRADGGYFSRVGFIVKTREEAQSLSERLLAFSDAGSNAFDTPYDRRLLRHAFVLAIDETDAEKVQRIEDVPTTMQVRASRTRANAQLIQRVRTAVERAGLLANEAVERFLASAVRTASGHVADVCGGAWVVTHETTSDITDALLKAGLARATGEHYAVDVKFDPREMALSPHEAGARAAAEHLKSALGQDFYVRTWWD